MYFLLNFSLARLDFLKYKKFLVGIVDSDDMLNKLTDYDICTLEKGYSELSKGFKYKKFWSSYIMSLLYDSNQFYFFCIKSDFILKDLFEISRNFIIDINNKNFLEMMYISDDNYKYIGSKKICKNFSQSEDNIELSSWYGIYKKILVQKLLKFLSDKKKCIAFFLNIKYLGSMLIYFKLNNDKSITLDLVTFCNKVKIRLESKISNLRTILENNNIKCNTINISSKEEILNNSCISKNFSLDNNILNHYFTVLSKQKKETLESVTLYQNYY